MTETRVRTEIETNWISSYDARSAPHSSKAQNSIVYFVVYVRKSKFFSHLQRQAQSNRRGRTLPTERASPNTLRAALCGLFQNIQLESSRFVVIVLSLSDMKDPHISESSLHKLREQHNRHSYRHKPAACSTIVHTATAPNEFAHSFRALNQSTFRM